MYKKKVTTYWFDYFCSQCPSYSSVRFFNISKLKPNKPHPIIINSGTSEYLNHKSSILLKMLCGCYCLNSLKHKFNTNTSPLCQMCTMRTIEDVDHFLTVCPYLDGARFYALLAPHGAQAVIAFRYYSTTLPYYPPIFSKYSPQTS